jgi:hypothetical protein
VKRLAFLLLLSLTACGGGSDDAGGVSKADYLTKTEAVCAKANADQTALKTPTSPEGIAPYVVKVVEIADTATTQIAAIEAPKKDKADLDAKVLTPLREQLTAGHEFADKITAAAKAKDDDALLKLLQQAPTQSKADLRWMKDYGFKECVEAADTSG